MNDLNTLKAMFDRAEIVYELDDQIAPSIKIAAKTGPKNHGWTGYTAWLNFDRNGSLIAVCVDEG